MVSHVLFVIMTVVAVILLLTASITATISASDIFSSAFYNTDSQARTGHQYLTVAAAIGWSALVILMIVLVVATLTGGFSSVTVSDAMLIKPSPTADEIVLVNQAYRILSTGRTTQLIVLIVLVLVTLATFIMGVLAAVGAANLGEMNQQDDSSRSAYIAAIIATITGLLGGGFMFVVSLSYAWLRSARDEELGKITLFQERTETIVANN